MFSQKLSALTKDEIQRLIGQRENDELEFKRELPSKKGRDPWMEGRKEIGHRAKSELTAEIIGFANTAGGVLILGLAEDDNKCATEVCLIPDCQELAERLAQSITVMVEPAISQFECVGVEFEDKQGVVVMRVGASGSAPHRDLETRQAFVRMGDRTEPMGMRQIQDMALDRWRARGKVEDILNSRTLTFESSVQVDVSFGQGPRKDVWLLCAGWRATSLPVERVRIKDIATQPAYRIENPEILFIDTEGQKRSHAYPVQMSWRPKLRGIVSETFKTVQPSHDRRTIDFDGMIEIACSAAEIQGHSGSKYLPVDAILASFTRLLIMTDVFRRLIGRPRMEVAFDFEWTIPVPLTLIRLGTGGDSQRLMPHQETNRLKDISMVGDIGPSEVWLEVQREFFQSFGLSVGNVYPVDFETSVRTLMSKIVPPRGQ